MLQDAQTQFQVSLGVFQLLSDEPLEIPVQPQGSMLSLMSHFTVCYTLMVGRRCDQYVIGSERNIRDAHQMTAKLEKQGKH